MASGMVYIGLSEEESLQLGFKLWQIGEIPQTGRQRIPDGWSDETNLACTVTYFTQFKKKAHKHK